MRPELFMSSLTNFLNMQIIFIAQLIFTFSFVCDFLLLTHSMDANV